MKINLSNGREYNGVLCVKRDTMRDDRWVGIWADPNGPGYVGTEGECSRSYFRTANAAAIVLAHRHNVYPKHVGVIRGYVWDKRADRVVVRACKAQYPIKEAS